MPGRQVCSIELLELLLAPVPSFAFACICAHRSILTGVCTPWAHPLVVINIVFFFAFSILLYAVSLIEGSTWV